MVLTRSQAGSRQPLDHAASPRASNPRNASSQRSGTPQQPSSEGGVVRRSARLGARTVGGGSATLSAAGSNRHPATRCRIDCYSCKDLKKVRSVKSYYTGRIYSVIDVDPEKVHCKLQNYIYLLLCQSCGVPYVGETVRYVNTRMNIHRGLKSDCKYFVEHYKHVCPGAGFDIIILEKIPGNGYTNGVVDDKMRDYRLEREDYWMKTLRTVYPYGLNERTKGMNSEIPVGKLFYPLPRHGEKYINERSRAGLNVIDLNFNLDTFMDMLSELDVEIRANECRKFLNRCKHKHLRKLAVEANTRLFESEDCAKRWYEIIVDSYFTKVYKENKKPTKKAPKYILPIYFDNKGLELLRLDKILRCADVTEKLPEQFQNDEPPSVVPRLSKTIRSKIFNYKQTVNDIKVSDMDTYGTSLRSCDCRDSEFIDTDHGHIVTGDLRIVGNEHLRKLFSKGPNFREPRIINWKKCRLKVEEGIEECAMKFVAAGKDVAERDVLPWKNEILRKVDEKITSLKRKIKPQRCNQILKRPDVITCLENLHKNYVIVPIDKAANNVSIICKRYYVEVILKEVGILGEGNNTYVKTEKTVDEIIQDNVEYSERLKLKVEEKDRSLPVMYWIPKKHKQPSGARFIIASKHCSTKGISKAVSDVFKLIYRQTENFHKNSKFLSNYNLFWVLQNANPIIETFDSINKKKRAKSISTYDFSTLYTKLPHDKLLCELSKIIDDVYKGGKLNSINVKRGKAKWGKPSPNVVGFTKGKLKKAIEHLIRCCYFTVGDLVMRQAIGIPMGIDPAPFWANLFLYSYEHRYMRGLITTDKVKARHFHSTKRFIDDLCAINDGNLFGQVYKEIYPEELELKLEHTGSHASFLNLDVTIEEGRFVYKLFDKRDAFPFSIVRMPHMESNIPSSIFYSALVGEFLRIARSTLRLEDFIPKAKELVDRMLKQGAQVGAVRRSLNKIICRHDTDFTRFGLMVDHLLKDVLP